MRALGWSECDIVEVDLSAIEATALGIALNRTAELAEWNDHALAELLSTLREEDALDGVGYSGEEIDDLLAEVDLAQRDPGDVADEGPQPPSVNPVARTGDLWLLGKHRLLCGDSTKPDDIARVLNGHKATLLSTDPVREHDQGRTSAPAPRSRFFCRSPPRSRSFAGRWSA
jgi:hypothetical protein